MSLTLREMTDDQVSRYIATGLDAFVAHYAANSGEPESDIRRRGEEQYASYFPNGRPAAGHQLMVVERDGQPIGHTWVGPHPYRQDDSTAAWLYDMEIHEKFRGHGYGRHCLDLVESHLARLGVSELGLNVFGDNDVARQLYVSANYREVAVTMTKALTPEPQHGYW